MAQSKKPGNGSGSKKAVTDRQTTADNLYSEITPAGDLKSLIAGVKAAQLRKTAQETRLTKKQINAQKAVLDAEYQAAKKKEELVEAAKSVDLEIAKEKLDAVTADKAELAVKKKDKDKKVKKQKTIADFNTLLKNLEDALDRKNANMMGVDGKDVAALKTAYTAAYVAWQKAKSKTNDPDADKLAAAEKQGVIEEMMRDFKKQIDLLDSIANRNERQLAAKKERTKTGTDLKKLDYDGIYKSKLSKFMDLGRNDKGRVSLSRSMQVAAGMVGRNLQNKASNLAPSALYNNGVSWALSKAGTNRGAVSAIMKVDRSIRYLGTTVKDAGRESFEWLQKSMGSMFTYLKHKWSQLSSGASSAGSLGKLIGFAALFGSLIKPLIEGINSELEKRYGKDYVQTFIRSMWDSAKGWMIGSLRKFIFGDPAADEKPGAPGSNLAVQQTLRKGLNPTVSTVTGFMAKNWGVGRKPEEQENLLASTLRAYKANTGDQKQIDANYLQFYLAGGNGMWLKQLSKPLYNDLKTTGFDVSRFKAEEPTKLRVAPAPGRAVGAAVAAAPSASSKPVTVSPPASQGADPKGGGGGGGSTSKGVALGNAQMPKRGVSDYLAAFNAGLLIN